MSNEAIEKAMRDYEAAGERVIAVVAEEYPVGSIVYAEIGRSTFKAKVLDHFATWWHSPTRMRLENLATGKVRDTDASSIVSVVSRPSRTRRG